MYDEPYGYDTDGDGFIDTDDSGSFFSYDFDGDGDIDADDDFYGFMMAEEGDFCLIATAVYGNINHPQVLILRNFRDQMLSQSPVGRKFIRWYYLHGRMLARLIQGKDWTARVCRMSLNGLTWMLQTFCRRSLSKNRRSLAEK